MNPTCAPCATSPGSCRRKNITYRLVCTRCAVKGISAVYIGESHRTWGDRAGEHSKAIETLNGSYASVRHHLASHGDETPMFTYHIMGTHTTSLERQIKEGLLIEKYDCNMGR